VLAGTGKLHLAAEKPLRRTFCKSEYYERLGKNLSIELGFSPKPGLIHVGAELAACFVNRATQYTEAADAKNCRLSSK